MSAEAVLRSRTERIAGIAALRRPIPELCALAGYAALMIYAIPRHEPWADEAQAWQLARSVPVRDLFTHWLRYEGSPGLWHLLLVCLSHLHVSYEGMHWVTGMIATIGVGLLIFLSPFPRYIKLSLPFTFFLAFQYAIVARSYVLAPILLFAVAVVWRRRPIYVAILLGLLGNVAMHAFAISSGLALLYLMELKKQRLPLVSRRDLLIAGTILAALYAAAIATVLPHPPDLSFVPPIKRTPFDWESLVALLLLCPISICTGLTTKIYLSAAFWVLLLVPISRARRVYYLLPVATFAIFAAYYTLFWHAGLIIPAILSLLWIAWPEVRQQLNWKPLQIGAACIIALQIGWTVYALRTHPYSAGPETAHFLAPRVAAGETIAVTYVRGDEVGAYDSTDIAPYFSHPIFLNQPYPFWPWSTRQNTTQQLLDALATHPPLVLVTYHNKERFDPAKNLTEVRVEYLQQHGYHMTRYFCGEKPRGFGLYEEICDLIFELERTGKP